MRLELEHVDCDLCGSDKYRVRYRQPDRWLQNTIYQFPVVECIACGLVYLNPRPTQDSMQIFYPPGYHDGRGSDEHRDRYEKQLRFLPELTTESVIDIGCARGDFLAFLKERYPGIHTTGLDFFSDGVAHSDIDFVRSLLPESKLPDSSFDLATSWAVFEHLHNPLENFQEVGRILKPGGRFVFLVTNSESFYGKSAYLEDIPRHTYHYSEKTLAEYARRSGLAMTGLWFDDEIFDGRGIGAFQFIFSEFVGVTWEDRLTGKKPGWLGRKADKLGYKLDKRVFKTHWEADRRRSGIMVAEFTR